MKKVIQLIAGGMFCAAIATGAYAQTPATTPTPTTTSPVSAFPSDKALTDPTMSQRLQADLGYRNEQLGNNPVNWTDTGNGYTGSYSIAGQDYMTMYNKDGRYVETLQKADWSDPSISADLKASYDKSAYKSSEVTGYWTTTDPTRKGSYFEVKNKQGKMSRVYADENGKFSTLPPKAAESVAAPTAPSSPNK